MMPWLNEVGRRELRTWLVFKNQAYNMEQQTKAPINSVLMNYTVPLFA